VTHVTPWDEEKLLAYFWSVVRDDCDRVAALKQLADVSLERPSEWDVGSIRQAFAGVKLTLTCESCFCCKTRERRLYWHHVIQVQHGGSNTPWNLVAICHACHRLVHPWLPAPTSLENKGGWTSVGEMAIHADTVLARAFAIEEHIRSDRENGA
jgi:hypothetical protein